MLVVGTAVGFVSVGALGQTQHRWCFRGEHPAGTLLNTKLPQNISIFVEPFSPSERRLHHSSQWEASTCLWGSHDITRHSNMGIFLVSLWGSFAHWFYGQGLQWSSEYGWFPVFVSIHDVKVPAATQLWILSLVLRQSETLEMNNTDFCPIKNPKRFSPHDKVRERIS